MVVEMISQNLTQHTHNNLYIKKKHIKIFVELFNISYAHIIYTDNIIIYFIIVLTLLGYIPYFSMLLIPFNLL